jgi:hypothetical protein
VHSGSSRLRRSIVPAAAALGAAGLFLTTALPASADVVVPTQKRVTTSNSYVLAACAVNIDQSYFDGSVLGHVTAQSQSNGVFSSFVTKQQVFCTLKDGAGNVISEFDPTSGSATLIATRKYFTASQPTTYTICARAVVQLYGGGTAATPTKCA